MVSKRPRHIEDDHQAALFAWASHNVGRLPALANMYAVPNGGKRNPREAARLKGQGVKAGVPDICLAYPMAPHCGLFIELKRPIIKGEPKPTLSKEQASWLIRLDNVGYRTEVCYGWQQAMAVILDYLGAKS